MRRGDMNAAILNWRKAVKLGPNQGIVQNLGRLTGPGLEKQDHRAQSRPGQRGLDVRHALGQREIRGQRI